MRSWFHFGLSGKWASKNTLGHLTGDKNKLWIWYRFKVLCPCYLYFCTRIVDENRENWVLRDNLKPFSFRFRMKITDHVLYPVRIVEMEVGTSCPTCASRGRCCGSPLDYLIRPSQFNASFPIARPTHFFGKVKKKNSWFTSQRGKYFN